MSRTTKIVLAVIGVLVAALSALVAFVAWTFSGTSDIEDGLALPGGARLLRDGFVAVAVIEAEPGKVALVDTGRDPDGAAILAELARRGLGPGDVTAVLQTHGHRDHVAACRLFPNAITYAHRDELPLLRGEARARGPVPAWLSPQPSGCAKLEGLPDGSEVALGARRARIFVVPGHTAGSAAWLVDGVLYLGDSAHASADGKILPALWVFSDDQARNAIALEDLSERLKAIPVDRIVFSHTGTLEGTALRMWASLR